MTRQSPNSNFDSHSRVQLSVEWTSALCPSTFLSLLRTGRISLSRLWMPGEQPLVPLSVRAYPRRCNRTQSTANGFSARVSTHGMWCLIFLSPSFLPFLLARTRNYSSLSYFLSFHSVRLRSPSYSSRVARRCYSKVDTRVNVHGNPTSVVRPRFVVHARWSTVYNEKEAPCPGSLKS